MSLDSSRVDFLHEQQLRDAKRAEPSNLPVDTSPALSAPREKYLFPMRSDNTEIFFDQAHSDTFTLMIVFARDHHGFVLDVLSVLKALNVKCWRTASSQSDTVRLFMARCEEELVSLNALDLSLDNCCAFWITDEQSGFKIDDDPNRLEQLRTCIKQELTGFSSRPVVKHPDAWHRVVVELNREQSYSVFSVQTSDKPNLLKELTAAFAQIDISICSAAIQTFEARVENTFYVRNSQAAPLSIEQVTTANEAIMRALLRVGNPSEQETLWYQCRSGSAVFVSEAVFIDKVDNVSPAYFCKFETPNFRGRLPDAPYCPVLIP